MHATAAHDTRILPGFQQLRSFAGGRLRSRPGPGWMVGLIREFFARELTLCRFAPGKFYPRVCAFDCVTLLIEWGLSYPVSKAV